MEEVDGVRDGNVDEHPLRVSVDEACGGLAELGCEQRNGRFVAEVLDRGLTRVRVIVLDAKPAVVNTRVAAGATDNGSGQKETPERMALTAE